MEKAMKSNNYKQEFSCKKETSAGTHCQQANKQCRKFDMEEFDLK
jgi:hypothetical protein